MLEPEATKTAIEPCVHFIEPDAGQALCVRYRVDATSTLLELARAHAVPLHWRCGLGTCGTCAVHVTVLEGVAPPINAKEANVLRREGKAPGNSADSWRLACGYPLGGQCLRVTLTA